MKRNTLTIGLDLGDRKHHACVLDASGKIAAEEVITNTRECIARFAERYPRATYIMETGTHSPWVSRLLEERGRRVIVANARKVRAICESQTRANAEHVRS